MEHINWRVLESHQMNYDGTCRYCNGYCKSSEAVTERSKLADEITKALLAENRKRYKYLRKREQKTMTWRWEK